MKEFEIRTDAPLFMKLVAEFATDGSKWFFTYLERALMVGAARYAAARTDSIAVDAVAVLATGMFFIWIGASTSAIIPPRNQVLAATKGSHFNRGLAYVLVGLAVLALGLASNTVTNEVIEAIVAATK